MYRVSSSSPRCEPNLAFMPLSYQLQLAGFMYCIPFRVFSNWVGIPIAARPRTGKPTCLSSSTTLTPGSRYSTTTKTWARDGRSKREGGPLSCGPISRSPWPTTAPIASPSSSLSVKRVCTISQPAPLK